MFGSWALNEIWIIDLFLALVGWLMGSSKLFIFSNKQSSFKLRCETVIGIVLCYSHQACCLPYYLGEIDSGIHTCQFTFEPLHLCFQMWLRFWIWTKILADRRIWWKKGTDWQICMPLSTPSKSLLHSKKYMNDVHHGLLIKQQCFLKHVQRAEQRFRQIFCVVFFYY